MVDIGDKLRKLRERNNLTRKEAVDKLQSLGIEISDKTLYGYESGRNAANADMFLALCKIYNCTNIANEFSNNSEDVLFTNAEWDIIEKYRTLDSHGKKMVDFTLNEEWLRSTQPLEERTMIDLSLFREEVDHFEPQAAHTRIDIDIPDEVDTSDDNIMNADTF